MLPSLRHPGRVLVLVLVAAALNAVPIELPGGVKLVLGSFVCLPLALALRLPWGPLAVALPMAVTIFTLGQPFVFLVVAAEAVWLAVGHRRWRHYPVLVDAAFWVLVGVPLAAGLYLGVGTEPADIVAVAVVTLVLNQVGAAALASFLLRQTRLAAWLEEHLQARRRMREMIFHSVFVLSIVPLALLGLGLSVLLRAYSEREDREHLGSTSQRLSQQLDLFLHSHAAAVTAAAGTLGRSGIDGGVLIEEVRRTHPAFITMLVADARGRIMHAAPARALNPAKFTEVGDREYFRQARDLDRTFVSGVFRGRGFGRDILVAISAPVRDAAGNFIGIVEGSLEVHEFARQIMGRENEGQVELLFADASGRVISSDAVPAIAPLTPLKHLPQAVLAAGATPARPGRFDRADGRGGWTRMTGVAARSAHYGVRVIAQRPLLAGLTGSGWLLMLFAGVAAVILGAAFRVTRGGRRATATPLEDFARSANRQAALRRVEPVAMAYPDAPYEVWIVFRAFNQLAVQLQGTYAMLRQTNKDLDRRVVERTAEAEAARRQAEAANQSKTDFLAMTSHEIRTPLNAIIGLADSLTDSVREPVAQARLRTIRSSGQRLMTVVNDLLDLSRVEAGKLDLCRAPLEVRTLVGEVRALFALRAGQQGLWLKIELETEQPLWIEADDARLQQVLINLVGNALKFTRTGGVTLRVKQESAGAEVGLRFAVIDTGPGIPADQQARLFQPYVQLPGAAQSPIPGTGLGLSICRRLVDLFGGTLAVRSEAGAGAEFYFSFRAARAPAPAVVPPPRAETAGPALRVLAADDNIANQEVLRSMLEMHCAQLVIVDGAGAALAELERTEFDAALIDLEMPDADGFSVARTVRAWRGSEASRGCRLIAFSAHAREQMSARCAASGFDDFVEKPIDRKELMRAVRERVTA